jgi:hypothetical protein
MSKRMTATKLVFGLTIGATLAVVGVTPAYAVTPVYCGGGVLYATQTTSYGRTQDAPVGDCGSVGVRVKYSHPGGSSWTTWTYNGTLITREAPNTNDAQHYSTNTGVFETP